MPTVKPRLVKVANGTRPSKAQFASRPARDHDESNEVEFQRPNINPAKATGILVLLALLVAGAFMRITGIEPEPARTSGGLNSSFDAASRIGASSKAGDSEEDFWKNPEISTTEKYLCRGISSSRFCSQRPLHPFVEAFEYHGRELHFANKNDNRTIQETIEYENKSFSLW